MARNDFAASLRILRRRTRQTQAQLASTVGVGQARLSLWESARLPPPETGYVLDLAAALGLDGTETAELLDAAEEERYAGRRRPRSRVADLLRRAA